MHSVQLIMRVLDPWFVIHASKFTGVHVRGDISHRKDVEIELSECS